MAAVLARPGARPYRRRAVRTAALPVGWPLLFLLYGFPVWWVLGLGSFATIVVAAPMAWQLIERRSARLPKGMGMYVLFLAWVLLSFVAVTSSPSMARPSSIVNVAVASGFRFACYLACLVVVAYVCTLPERLLPTRRIVGGLATLWLVTVIGGFAGMVLGDLSFTTPFEAVLPAGIRSIGFVKGFVHPGFAQVQTFLGRAEARPKAPFEYTNEWGGNLSLLLPWAVAWWWTSRNRAVRLVGPAVFAVSVVPVIASLNRALWACLVLAALVVAAWLLALGHRWILVLGGIGVAAVAVGLVATPLGSLVQERLDNPHSNDRRGYMVAAAIDGAGESPLIGWGGTRPALGSDRTITAGASPGCPQCGTPSIGTHGQLWLVVFAQGFVGAALFLGFLLLSLWRYGRTADAYAVAASVGLVLLLVEATVYNQLPLTLWLAMLGIALAWRSRQAGGLAPLPRRGSSRRGAAA